MTIESDVLECAYCGRTTIHWIIVPIGPLCLLPTDSCWDISTTQGSEVINNLRIGRHAHAWFTRLAKSHGRNALDGPTGMIIASFLCAV